MLHSRLTLFACAAALILACGGDERTVETEAGDLTFEAEGDRVVISGEQEGVGEISGQFGEDAEVPEAFPKDLPLYPDAKVMGSMLAGGGGMITLQSGDDPDEVVDFYREKLVDEGWTISAEMDLGEQRVLAVEKEGRNGAVQVSREGSDTTILVTIGMGD